MCWPVYARRLRGSEERETLRIDSDNSERPRGVVDALRGLLVFGELFARSGVVAVGAGEVRFEEAAGVGVGRAHYLFGGAGGDELAAGVAAFGAEVDDVVGGLDYVEVMFDDEERAAGVDERAEGRE